MNTNDELSLYLGNLDYEVTREDLDNLFSRYGKIKELNLIQKKGIAYVSLENIEDAELAQKALDGIAFLNRKLVIDWASNIKSNKKSNHHNIRVRD